MRALAWARVPAWACRLGAGRPVGPDVGGLASGTGSFWVGWIFGNGDSLLLAENYNEQLPITPQRRRAHRDLTAEDGTVSCLPIRAGTWASLARAAHRHAASLPGSKARVPGSAARGPGRSGWLVYQAFLLGCA